MDSASAPRVILGVTGGIAAYKTVYLLRHLQKSGAQVKVIPTKNALEFVGKATWEALSGQNIHTDVFAGASGVEHVQTGSTADLLLIAPATANTIAKIAQGVADNLLTATALMSSRLPRVLVPAMHTQMWESPRVQANIATLKADGWLICGPANGRLTGPDSGPGRMVEPEEIVEFISSRGLLTAHGSRAAQNESCTADNLKITGKNVVISAGGTREPVDAVRFLGNRSTGLMGAHLARKVLSLGGQVQIVSAHVDSLALAQLQAKYPEKITVHPVSTALEMLAKLEELMPSADALFMAAAVADYRPALPAETKLKKSAGALATVEIVENPDILATLAARRRDFGSVIIVGFAAETGDDSGSVIEYARRKARAKGCDYLVANQVGKDTGFGPGQTAVSILDADGNIIKEIKGEKEKVAADIISTLLLGRKS